MRLSVPCRHESFLDKYTESEKNTFVNGGYIFRSIIGHSKNMVYLLGLTGIIMIL